MKKIKIPAIYRNEKNQMCATCFVSKPITSKTFRKKSRNIEKEITAFYGKENLEITIYKDKDKYYHVIDLLDNPEILNEKLIGYIRVSTPSSKTYLISLDKFLESGYELMNGSWKKYDE